MCHSLVMNYGLYKRMEIFVSERGSTLFSPPLLLPWCLASDRSVVVENFLFFFLARQARDEARNDTISF